MKLKQRIVVWYAKRTAKKQAQDSQDQVVSAPAKSGSKAAAGARKAGGNRNK